MFKKITLIALMVSVLSCMSFAQAGNRAKIDKFLKSYEEFVVQSEKLAKSNSISDLMKLEVQAEKLSEQADEIQNYDEWTMKDLQKYTDLTMRYSNAMSTVSNSIDLGAYSF